MHTLLLVPLSLLSIVSGAHLFTNGVEWLGRKLSIGEGAVGSLLAAIGTALPETMVPVIAILFGKGQSADAVGIGAIIGAPFLLATLGFFIITAAARAYRRRGDSGVLYVNAHVFDRDLTYFLGTYSVALAAGVLPSRRAQWVCGAILILAYVAFVLQALMASRRGHSSGEGMKPLFLARSRPNPPLPLTVIQVIMALFLVVIGAKGFVSAVESVSAAWGVSTFLLSMVFIPIATELPETLNSVVWIRQRKDTLAVSNITGAMVFQSTLVPAIGIFFTPWRLDVTALVTGLFALLAASVAMLFFRYKHTVVPISGFLCGLLYFVLPTWVMSDATDWWRWIMLAMIVALCAIVTYNYRKRSA